MSRQHALLAISLVSAAGCAQSDGPEAEVSAAVTGAPPIDLVAIGQLSGTRSDRSRATAGTLENGVAGNLLGGLGSGIDYAGFNLFVAVPDRGPNAVPFNPAVDDTATYIDRVQTLYMQLERSAPGAALPFALTPHLLDTTLLRSAAPLHYGAGADVGLADGTPGLNAARHTHYFTGRSDGFDPATLSTDATDARLDPESVRVSNDGRRLF